MWIQSAGILFSVIAALATLGRAVPAPAVISTISGREGSTCPPANTHSRAESFKLKTTLPGIPFAIPQSYAGYIPVNHTAGDNKRQLYFWYTPVDASVGSADDIVIWFNGGPGCSSMTGLLQENGPFRLPYYPEGSTVKPEVNPWSNHRAAHAIWIDSPGDTGLSQGGTHIKGLAGTAEDIVGFLINFFDAFPDLRGKRLWLQGESYAGATIPYMADRIYSDDSLLCKGINLKGIQVNDPLWASETWMQQLPIFPYAEENMELLGLNESQIEQLRATAAQFGLDTYYADNLVYPPKGPLRLPANWTGSATHDLWGDVLTAWSFAHCSSAYDISTQCPSLLDPLGFPLGSNQPSYNNFINNQTGFLAAINAKPGVTYVECKGGVYDDLGEPLPNESVMPGVIARSERVIIAGADNDMLLLTKGSELAIQNMTWNGAQGFQKGKKMDFVTSEGIRGHYIAERSLSLVSFAHAGHLIPENDPEAAYKATQYLIGKITSLS